MGEITVILLLALIFLGPKRLPELASGLGKIIRDIRKATSDVKNEIALDDTFRKPFEELRDAVTLHPDELKRRDQIKQSLENARGRHGFLVERQWHVPMEVLHLAGADVVVADLRVDVVLEMPAERALRVSVLDDGQRRGALAPERLAGEAHGRRRLQGRLSGTSDHFLQLIQAVEDLLLLDCEPRDISLQLRDVGATRL
jgi:Sec-independent protein translocase protein TatA